MGLTGRGVVASNVSFKAVCMHFPVPFYDGTAEPFLPWPPRPSANICVEGLQLALCL